MNFDEYRGLDGLQLGAMVREGQVTGETLMTLATDAARRLDASLNFLKYSRFDESLALARSQDQQRGATQGSRPFEGVPFLWKDSGIAARRFPTSVGSCLLAGTTFEHNGEFADRVEAAGFLPFARTTVPEMCMGPNTEAVANDTGVTKNPWNHELSTGGSSGGSAAAVAAGIVPVAHGSDGGGSIRIPATNCGLVGLKVSRGRFPTGPGDGETWGDLIADGFLTRSVADMAAAVDAVQGVDAGAPFAAPFAPPSYLAAMDQPPARPLRIALWMHGWDGVEATDAPTREALQAAASACEALGHSVREVAPVALDYRAFADAHTAALAASLVSTIDNALAAKGRALAAGDVQFNIADGYEYGKTISANTYSAALGRFRRIGRLMGRYMMDWDLVLCPTVPTASMRHGRFPRERGFIEFRAVASAYNAFTALGNASGQPAISVPLHRTREGWPVGVQFMAAYGREDLLLAVARQLEIALPWKQAYPAL